VGGGVRLILYNCARYKVDFAHDDKKKQGEAVGKNITTVHFCSGNNGGISEK
jgi:hypothetical protein